MTTQNRYYSGPTSDHFDGLRFFNPGQPPTDRSLRDLWRWRSERAAVEWPAHVAVTPTVPESRTEQMRITMVGHATLLIQVAGLNILTDPVWSDRTSPVTFAGPRRVTAPGIALEDVPAIDVVLVSHNHYDHLDLATLRHLHDKHQPSMVMPLGNDTIVRSAIPGARIVVGDWGSSIPIGPSATATMTRANHWSNRGLRDRRMALWAGFLVGTNRGSVWFAGDTGYGDGSIFRDMRARYGAPDVALIPIGAYEPRWFMAAQHVDPQAAVRVFQDIGARHALGIHWGTFRLTDEGREAPREELLEALARAGVDAERFIAAEPGQAFDFSNQGCAGAASGT
ncbi:MAG TPA: MBL fold metallo-hydrolase [Steroidobacteraceae bacterium]|nr:MBL fold metallo-hydrolase [Steroidobacteraceae bacterium]